MLDRLDNRVLGAVRFVDATVKTPILALLEVRASRGVTLIRNRSNLHVITGAPGLTDYAGRFVLPSPPPAAAPVAVTLTIRDPAGRYLPRSATVTVPRDPDPARAGQPGSLFQPIDIELFPAPVAAIGAGWAVLRISVKRAGGEVGVPFAYVRVRRASDDALLARGLADERGEALVAVPGIPVTLWNTAPAATVVTSTVAAKVAAHFDRTAFDPTTARYPDPDALERVLATLPSSADVPLDLASGREVPQRIDMTLTP